jgi:hypothetical protein
MAARRRRQWRRWQREVGGSLAAAHSAVAAAWHEGRLRRWRQRDSATLAAVWRQRQRRWRQRDVGGSLARGALAAGAAWGLRALSLREEEEKGVLGGGLGRLGAAGGKGGGQRRRRRRGDFGLNTPFSILRLRRYFFSETIFWCVAGCLRRGLKPQRSPTRKKMVPVFPHFNQRAAWPACPLRSGCAADRSGCGG